MKSIIFLFIFSLPTLIFSQITKDVGDFNSLKVGDRLAVELYPSDKNEVIIVGEYVDKVKVVNSNGTLTLKMDFAKTLAGHRTHIKVYCKKIDKIIVNEGSTLSSDETLVATTFSIKVRQGSVVTLPVKTERLDLNVSSGAIASFKGQVSQQNVSVQSGGIYNADELQSDLAVINVFAGGNATVLVSKSLEANVKAGGVINVYGNPKELRQDILLGGVINKFAELPDSE